SICSYWTDCCISSINRRSVHGYHYSNLVFFFQAEDGIRDRNVTGVQTCALPIWADHPGAVGWSQPAPGWSAPGACGASWTRCRKIGRASCRGRVWMGVDETIVLNKRKLDDAEREFYTALGVDWAYEAGRA